MARDRNLPCAGKGARDGPPKPPLLVSACLLHSHRKRAKTCPWTLLGRGAEEGLHRLGSVGDTPSPTGGVLINARKAPPQGLGKGHGRAPQGQESQCLAEATALSLTPLFLSLIYDPPKLPVTGNRPHDHSQEETSNRGGPRGSRATQTRHRLQTTAPSKSQGPKGVSSLHA